MVLNELGCESYVEGAICVRFDLKNFEKGGLGLISFENSIEIEIHKDLLEINVIHCIMNDINAVNLR